MQEWKETVADSLVSKACCWPKNCRPSRCLFLLSLSSSLSFYFVFFHHLLVFRWLFFFWPTSGSFIHIGKTAVHPSRQAIFLRASLLSKSYSRTPVSRGKRRRRTQQKIWESRKKNCKKTKKKKPNKLKETLHLNKGDLFHWLRARCSVGVSVYTRHCTRAYNRVQATYL